MTSSAAVTSVIIYTDDAAELTFSDGTQLELSPCGASFVCRRPTSAGHHPLIGGTRIQQRTEFATSEFKDKVRQALECRNRFAECPYLCQQFLPDGSVFQLFADVSAVEWKKNAESVSGNVHPNGIVQITSVDECCSLYLSANRQEFTVEFLCRLSQKDNHKQLSNRCSKVTNLSERNAEVLLGRPSTDLDLGGDNEKAACDAHHGVPSESVCMQDSPYLQTLVAGKVPLRKSLHGSGKHRSLSSGSGGEVAPSEGQDNNRIRPVEELIAIKHGYTWVVQHHTVEHCSECWKQPLNLALNFVPKEHLSSSLSENRSKTLLPGSSSGLKDGVQHKSPPEMLPSGKQHQEEHTKEDHGNNNSGTWSNDGKTKSLPESTFDVAKTSLPSPLPLTCSASHLHKWRVDRQRGGGVDLDSPEDMDIPVGQSIKVWFSNGIIYRLSRTPQPAVHIYPGDGTLIKSTGPDGRYFTHIIPSGGNCEERMLSARSLPPDNPGAAYSIAGVLRKASRLLQTLLHADIMLVPREEHCCWKETLASNPLASPRPTVVLEESKVEGLGHFVAFSNGRVRVVFDDRTTLDMEWDFRNRVAGNHHKEDNLQNLPPLPAASKQLPKIRKSFFASDLQRGVCRLLLHSGEHKSVLLDDPQEFHRYVGAAVEWASWVASSPDERIAFYENRESQLTEQDRSVQMELQKIQRFEYILDNTLPSGQKPAAPVPANISTHSPYSNAGAGTRGANGGSVFPHSSSDDVDRPCLVPGGTVPVPSFVKDALEMTSSAIRNIDAVLGQDTVLGQF